MLKRFAEALLGKTDAEAPAIPSENRTALATCAVLLEAASIDDEYTLEEKQHILQVLQSRFSLSEEEAGELLREATRAHNESTDLFRFTHEINRAFSTEEKIDVMREVWRIFYSDGVLDGHEDQLAHKLQDLLNLNHPQLIEAKMSVRKEVLGD
jgi:uncharacterized tellurite resistance protein B-like protein